MRIEFRSASHDVSVSARLGRWLGGAFALCLLTGLASHAVQHTGLPWPTRPVGLYRVTQGVHVLSGITAVPLLLAKLWSVYPKLFERPRLRTIPARAATLVLVAAAFFELVSGSFNVAKSYPWTFFFPTVHYAVAWILAGGLLVHLGLRLPQIRAGLAAPVNPQRRAFLRTTGLAAAAALLSTAGTTVPLLRRVSVLAWRSPTGVPVNRTAAAAGISIGPDWRLTVGSHAFTYGDLLAMPQHTAELPIACVEGWSASATWTGVRVRDLLAAAGVPADRPIRVTSLDEGRYGRSTLPAVHVADPLTLLALRLNGQVLSPDHGYPCRLITASRPGVLQTKWVSRMETM